MTDTLNGYPLIITVEVTDEQQGARFKRMVLEAIAKALEGWDGED